MTNDPNSTIGRPVREICMSNGHVARLVMLVADDTGQAGAVNMATKAGQDEMIAILQEMLDSGAGPNPNAGTSNVVVSNLPADQQIHGAVTVTGVAQDTSVQAVSQAVGAQTDTPAATDGATGSLLAFTKRVAGLANNILTLITNRLPASLGGSGGVKIEPAGASLPVSGSVAVSNLPATQAVSGNVTATISGTPSVNATLTGTPTVNATVAFPASQTVNGSVGVNNFPATQQISAVALPLPTGATTAANQVLMQTALDAIKASLSVTGRTPKVAPISITSVLGAVQYPVVPVVTGKKIKVYGIEFKANAAIAVTIQSGSTNLLGAVGYIANAGPNIMVNPPNFLYATAAGQALNITAQGIGTLTGSLYYWDDDAS